MMNEDDIVRELAELKTAVASIAQSQRRIERILTEQSGSLAVLVAHDGEHKKKLSGWLVSSKRPSRPVWQK